MTTKQKILSKDIWVRTAETQPFFAFLSIIQNFSLGLLCKALHNRPIATELAKFSEWVVSVYQLLPPAVSAAFFFFFAFAVFFGLLKMLH